MGPLAQFILALTNLVRSGVIKKVPQAIKFAEQQFGKVTPLLKKQIEKVFESAKKPLVGKPGKKEGTVLPLIKKIAEKKNEGITSLEDSSPLMDKLGKDVEEFRLSDDDPMGDLEQILNPKRPGGSLDQATGITRALVRRILERKGIQIGKKDPITVFTDIFGESISDVNNLAEEMIEIDARGGGMKDMDQMLEADGLFDIEIPTNPQKGLTDDQLLDLVKKTDEEKILTDFDPKGRKPNATGGLMRTSYAIGGRIGLDTGGTPLQKLRQSLVDDLMYKFPNMKEEDMQMIVKDINLGMSTEEAQASMSANFTKVFGSSGMFSTGGRVGYNQGSSLDSAVRTVNPVQDSGNKIEEVLKAYGRYLGNRKGSRISFSEFFELYSAENFAEGGRVRAASGGLAKILNL